MRVRFKEEMLPFLSSRCFFLRWLPPLTDFCFAVAATVEIEATGCSSKRSTLTSNNLNHFRRVLKGLVKNPGGTYIEREMGGGVKKGD